MGVRLITEPSNATEKWLLDTVRTHALKAGIGMPEVGIFDSPQPNAFATGASRNNALVAVSTGLLQSMRSNEVDAVLGHEIAHVANGDMVTLTLIQGVVNTFVIFFSRIIGSMIDKAVFRSEKGNGPAYFITVMVTELVLGILANCIVMWFSRQREFRADAGGALYAGRDNMIAALERLKSGADAPLPDALAAFGGLEIVTMTGAVLQAAAQRRVILVDGFIASAAVLVAHALQPLVLQRCVFAHRSGERGHEFMLQHLGVQALLDLGLRLGEGSGAALAWPLLQSACAILREMASFASAGVSEKSTTITV
jgi:hypothetical protein